MPGETLQALSMANALLVADGLLTPEEVRARDGMAAFNRCSAQLHAAGHAAGA